PMLAEGTTPWEAAVANAMADPLAIGPGRYRHATSVEEVDTVYLGTYARDEFIELGGYRSFPSGTVEDADFYARWRSTDRTVVVDPKIRSWYRPRGSWSATARQFWRYGKGKAELLILNGRFPSLRPLAPAILVAAFATAMIVGPLASWVPLALVTAAWAAALIVVGLRADQYSLRTVAAAATMHLAYGVGLWTGLVGSYSAVRKIRTEPAPLSKT
ncbi:MAG: hypothetical protein ACR2N9_12085, partial [Acidimicrobiia bacterium]